MGSKRSAVKQAAAVAGDEELKLRRKIESLQRKNEELKRRDKASKIRADEAEKLLADHHASRFDIPRQKIRKHQGKGSFVRVFMSDTHGASLDKKAWAAFIRDMEYLKPREIIHGGDIVDCGGWLSAHHTLHYVAETSYTYSDDIIAGNLMFDQLQAVAPKARIFAIQGNHDARVERFAVTAAMRNSADAELLRKGIDPEFLLHIKKRGIEWIKRSKCYNGSSIAGSVRRGRCWFTHPQSSSKHHAANMVSKFQDNVVFGHTHRRDSYPNVNVNGDEHGAWNPGCLCHLRKYWHHSEPSRHNHGYHIQLTNSDGTFLPVNVPIMRGRSYLPGLLKIGSG